MVRLCSMADRSTVPQTGRKYRRAFRPRCLWTCGSPVAGRKQAALPSLRIVQAGHDALHALTPSGHQHAFFGSYLTGTRCRRTPPAGLLCGYIRMMSDPIYCHMMEPAHRQRHIARAMNNGTRGQAGAWQPACNVVIFLCLPRVLPA